MVASNRLQRLLQQVRHSKHHTQVWESTLQHAQMQAGLLNGHLWTQLVMDLDPTMV
jgi:hypothetical protein